MAKSRRKSQTKRSNGSKNRTTATARTGARKMAAPRAAGERPTIQAARDWARKPSPATAKRPAPARTSTSTRATTAAGGSTRRSRRAEQRANARLPITPGLPAVVRGGFQGFVILLFGELLTLPFRGNGLILYWVALVAYAWAGNRAASASLASVPRAARDGAGAAVFAYLLTIPLRQMSHSLSFSFLYTVVALATAVIIGGLAAVIVARARRPRLDREDTPGR